jgi:hypothetical protein
LPAEKACAILPPVEARQKVLIVRDVGDETIVYDRRTHRAHCLAPAAAAVWRAWDGERGLREVARRAGQARGALLDEASVRRALRRLERAGLIDRSDVAADDGDEARRASGRRAALRAVAAGFAVWSLATRSPAQAAATCLPPGRACQRSSECCSDCCNRNSGNCIGAPPTNPNCLPP